MGGKSQGKSNHSRQKSSNTHQNVQLVRTKLAEFNHHYGRQQTQAMSRFLIAASMMDPHELVLHVRAAFDSGRTFCVEFRNQQLAGLKRMYEENRADMIKALEMDLRKCKMEASITEVDFLLNDVKHTMDKLHEWVKPEEPKRSLVNVLDKLQIIHEPYGVVLIIGAWNYPLQLTLLPLHGAIAAGNCVIMKPSEVALASATLIMKLIPKYLDRSCYQVYCGGVSETTKLLEERFDYIFYTGSSHIGKIIHQAANKYLTPVTLELGGKSPVFLDNMDNIEIATTRILWGKFINAGQTCVAPDYILCSKETQGRFVAAAKQTLKRFYGKNPKQSPDLCRIINHSHYKRVAALLKDTTIAIGGNTDAGDRYIEPTIIVDVKSTDAIMQEEIFGPVLPIMTVGGPEEAIRFIRSREKPLALYVFSQDRKVINKFVHTVSAGGICVNDTISHICVDTLPFGGIGMSGMGSYHGKATFDTFVHCKSVLTKSLGMIGEKMTERRYPPYDANKLKFITTALEYRRALSLKYIPYLIVFGLGMATTLFVNYITRKEK